MHVSLAFQKPEISHVDTVPRKGSHTPEMFFSVLIKFQTPETYWKALLKSREVAESRTRPAWLGTRAPGHRWCVHRSCCSPDLESQIWSWMCLQTSPTDASSYPFLQGCLSYPCIETPFSLFFTFGIFYNK